MDPRRALGVGLGVLLFIGPLVALYLHMREDLARLGEGEGGGGEAGAAGRRTEPGGAKTAPARPSSISSPPSSVLPPAAFPAGPALTSRHCAGPAEVAVSVRRAGPDLFEVALRNETQGRMLLAVPAELGRAVRVVPEASSPGPLPWPAFDRARDAAVPLPPGAWIAVPYRMARDLPPGRVKAVYDCTGAGVPDGAWRGRVESAPVD